MKNINKLLFCLLFTSVSSYATATSGSDDGANGPMPSPEGPYYSNEPLIYPSTMPADNYSQKSEYREVVTSQAKEPVVPVAPLNSNYQLPAYTPYQNPYGSGYYYPAPQGYGQPVMPYPYRYPQPMNPYWSR